MQNNQIKTNQICNVPNGWGMNRMISLGQFSKGKNITKSDLTLKGFPCILYSHIYTEFDRIFTEVNSYIDENKFSNSTKIIKGQFLFTSSGETVEDIGKCVLYNGEETISIGGDIIVFTLFEPIKFDEKFLSYVFNADFFNNQKSSNSNGEIVVHIYEKQLREIKFTYPKLPEQKLISQYLDEKTQKVDLLIEKIEKKIQLLKEQKTAIINQYVIKGLDPFIEMKDSGVESFGEIPKHWIVKKLKYIAELNTGSTPETSKEEFYKDGKTLWIKPGDLNNFIPITHTEQKLSEAGLYVSRELKENSCLVCGIGDIGKFGFSEEKVTTNQQIHGITFDDQFMIAKYGIYIISTLQEKLIKESEKVVVSILTKRKLGLIKVILPPLYEQEKICTHLDKILSNLNVLENSELKKINLLYEYRQSLISSVVTGKIRITEDML